MAPQHPEWKTKQPYRAVLDGDMEALAASGEKGVIELLAVTHAGMTTDEFFTIVSDWTRQGAAPRFKRPYIELVYRPILELLRLPTRERLQDLYRLGRWGRVHARLRRAGLRHPA